jgi:hypothetical protein
MRRGLVAILAGATLAVLGATLPAQARDHWHGHSHGHGWGGPHVSLSFNSWRGGYWHEGWYGPRFGWWWVVPSGGSYYYREPVYPYPDYYRPYTPSTVVIEREAPPPPVTGAPPAQYWYYCKNPEGYYPYVSECRGEWRQVPVTPQDK